MNERDKVKQKIIGLLAKTESAGASEFEALAAADKAAELMAHYDIEATELDFRSRSCVKKSAPFQKYRNVVIGDGYAVAIVRLCDCRGWRVPYEQEQVFFGFEQDVEIAIYLYKTVAKAVINEIEAYKNSDEYNGLRARGFHGSTLITSFLHGINDRVFTRINELANEKKEIVSKGNNALVPLKAEQIKSEFDDLGMSLRSSRRSRTIGSSRAASSGSKAGKKIKIGTGIDGGADRKAIA